jgi:glycosidase
MKFRYLLTAVALVASAIVGLQPASSVENNSSQVGLARDLIYFVMPDRYQNGDTNNDQGDGFDPSNTAFFHGGDLKGLTGNCQKGDNGLARIKDLGFTAVWITPVVRQQRATPGGAGYHGYWGVDFLNVEPHLGTAVDLAALSACAKKLGIKLILDVVTNHTGDVIQYQDRTAYLPAGKENEKNPVWLNDLTNYHNVGDMSRCWGEGSCTQIGDFYGLDDLATEKEVVYKGLVDIYSQWIEKYGFVGFRVDTARHVDNEFFKNWSPGINQSAAKVGINNFTIFGEVWDINPVNLVSFIRDRGLQTALDFPFQRTAVQFSSGYSGAEVMANLFDTDDMYTTANSSASNLVTFLGNHDMGRVGFLLAANKVDAEKNLLTRTQFAHALMYLSRGIPTVYYGDEVGMTGSGNGGDQRARQDMFATKVQMWKQEKRIGASPVGNGDSFRGPENPISTYIRSLADLRAKYPALANGAMQMRYAKNNLLIFSKYDVTEKREFIVAFNSADRALKYSISTSSTGKWSSVFGKGAIASSGLKATISLPPLSASVFAASGKIKDATGSIIKLESKEDFVTGYRQITAQMDKLSLQQVIFEIRKENSGSWQPLGIDENWPYRIYIDPAHFDAKSTIEVRARLTSDKGGARGKAISIQLP